MRIKHGRSPNRIDEDEKQNELKVISNLGVKLENKWTRFSFAWSKWKHKFILIVDFKKWIKTNKI